MDGSGDNWWRRQCKNSEERTDTGPNIAARPGERNAEEKDTLNKLCYYVNTRKQNGHVISRSLSVTH